MGNFIDLVNNAADLTARSYFVASGRYRGFAVAGAWRAWEGGVFQNLKTTPCTVGMSGFPAKQNIEQCANSPE